MSHFVSRYLHPLGCAHRPSPEPEVLQAMLASLASDRAARGGQRDKRR